MPPTSGPKAAPPEPTAAHSPSAILRWLASAKVLRMPASVAGTIIAAPTASRAREAISVRAVGDSAAHSEATPKIALPSSSRRLKPILSPRAPIGSTIPAITNE
ncbi:hypothetical protein SB00610_01767 [Klebsiella quasipneumoniae subsp. similipneumoniae]|nr:hypothetical protein SB00610_01767 [Klebsiella quasipneumoniae subsp. similipneumoniae]